MFKSILHVTSVDSLFAGREPEARHFARRLVVDFKTGHPALAHNGLDGRRARDEPVGASLALLVLRLSLELLEPLLSLRNLLVDCLPAPLRLPGRRLSREAAASGRGVSPASGTAASFPLIFSVVLAMRCSRVSAISSSFLASVISIPLNRAVRHKRHGGSRSWNGRLPLAGRCAYRASFVIALFIHCCFPSLLTLH